MNTEALIVGRPGRSWPPSLNPIKRVIPIKVIPPPLIVDPSPHNLGGQENVASQDSGIPVDPQPAELIRKPAISLPAFSGFFLLDDLVFELQDLEDLATRLEDWASKVRAMHAEGVQLRDPDPDLPNELWLSTDIPALAERWELQEIDDRSPLSLGSLPYRLGPCEQSPSN